MGVLKIGCFYARAMYSFIFFIIQEGFNFMALLFHPDLQVWRRKGSRFFLAFFWLTGILSGAWISVSAGAPLLSLMRSALNGSVSVVGLLLVTTLPFLLSALAVFLSGPGWLFPLSFGYGFVYAYVSLAVLRSFGSAGWLIRFLLCFSVSAVTPILYFFWLRHVAGDGNNTVSEVFFFLSLAVLIGSIDYSLVSPFLAGLIIQ